MTIKATQPAKVELLGVNNDGALRRFTIADGDAVSQYDVLQLLDPRTVSRCATAAAGVSLAMAGLAAAEHLPNVGETSISVITDGIFEMDCSGAIALGAPISGCLNNYAITIANMSGASVMGYCMETAADEERANMRIRL